MNYQNSAKAIISKEDLKQVLSEIVGELFNKIKQFRSGRKRNYNYCSTLRAGGRSHDNQ